jgi:actin cytoskeleton-regulatory complex protein PAN1
LCPVYWTYTNIISRSRDNRSNATNEKTRDITPVRQDSRAPPKSSSPAPGGSSTYSSYKTAEDRAAFIKQQAEQRMAERLAALGLKPPPKSNSPAPQKQDTEALEREQRRKQAEEEDAKREQERQRRLAEEKPTPPSPAKPVGGKKPPPPPTRGARGAQQAEAKRKAEEDARQKAEQEERERVLNQERESQEAQTRELE